MIDSQTSNQLRDDTCPAFWQKKLAANQARDRLVTRTLRRAGWRVLRIWEHTLRQAARGNGHEARLVARVQRALARSDRS